MRGQRRFLMIYEKLKKDKDGKIILPDYLKECPECHANPNPERST
jgi:hypothetical protein